MTYQQIKIFCSEEHREILISLFSQWHTASFEEHDQGFIIYIPTEDWTDKSLAELHHISNMFPFEFTSEKLENKNWNELWESNFEAVQVGNFCQVRADFHTPNEEIQHDILINPKLAFGTGHHETTFLMIQKMEGINFQDKSVFDFGCGTSVLAILAEKLGAENITALDNDPLSTENSLENIKVNECSKIKTVLGGVEKVENMTFDIILANINRHVLLQDMQAMKNAMKRDAVLILSGILEADYALIDESAQQTGLRLAGKDQKGEWLCLEYKLA